MARIEERISRSLTASPYPTLLLTGAAGFFGQRFLAKTQTKWSQIYVHDRAPVELPPGLQNHCQTIKGDLRDPSMPTTLPDGVDVVIHAAAALPSHSPDEIFETDVRATNRLASWAAEIGVSRFIHLSSTAVYGPAHTPLIDETAQTRAFDPYNTAKIRAEDEVRQSLTGSSTTWTILRPKAIVGPGRLGLFGHLYEFADSGHRFPVLSGGQAVYQFLHVDDLVTAVQLAVAADDRAHGQTINVASRADHNIATLFQSVLDNAGHGKRIFSVPGPLAGPPLKLANALGWSPVYSRVIQNLVKGSTVSLERAASLLDFEPAHDGMTALADGFAWYQGQNARQEFEYGNGHSQLWRNPLAQRIKRFI